MAREAMCFTHTDTPAVTRCSQCSKPLCAMCVIEVDGRKYCGDDCVGRFQKFSQRPDYVPDKRPMPAWMRLVIILIAAAALVYIGGAVFKIGIFVNLLRMVGLA
jgi:hypothetical protein